MAESVEVRIPKWLVYVVVAVLLIGAGVGAGLVVGGEGNDASVATGKRPKGSTTSTSTTSTTAAPEADGGGNAGANGGGGNAGGGNAGDDNNGGAVAPPAAPAATADVTKSNNCPTVVTWHGTGGVGYTLQVNGAPGSGAKLFPNDGSNYGPVAADGQMSFDCIQAQNGAQVPRVGSVFFNTNTATGTVSDSA